MIYLDTFLYYTIFSSIVLIYGIGINRLAEIGNTEFNHIIFFVKSVLSIFGTVLLSWIIIKYILTPINLIELYPIMALLVFICLNSFLEALIRLTTGKKTTEFVISFLIVLLALAESTSIIDCIIICLSCFASLILLIPVVYTLKARITTNGRKINEKFYSVFFMFLALLIIVISVWDIMWLNPGVIK